MAVAASIPPTPQPKMPSPLIIGVWLSMPTRLSGKATPPRTVTGLDRYSRFTWCTMPLEGGTTRKLSNCAIAQRTTPNRSRLRSISARKLRANASAEPVKSARTEWSITRSTGIWGLTR